MRFHGNFARGIWVGEFSLDASSVSTSVRFRPIDTRNWKQRKILHHQKCLRCKPSGNDSTFSVNYAYPDICAICKARTKSIIFHSPLADCMIFFWCELTCCCRARFSPIVSLVEVPAISLPHCTQDRMDETFANHEKKSSSFAIPYSFAFCCCCVFMCNVRLKLIHIALHGISGDNKYRCL